MDQHTYTPTPNGTPLVSSRGPSGDGVGRRHTGLNEREEALPHITEREMKARVDAILNRRPACQRASKRWQLHAPIRRLPAVGRPRTPSAAGVPTRTDDLTRRLVAWLDPQEDWNYRHFRMRHMAAELLRTLGSHCVLPGCPAPDFVLESTGGERLRLGGLRGQPVLLHFVSYTCPVTRGTMGPMKELYRLYGDRVQFVDMLVRQAHPGERRGAYRSYATKLEDACRYQQEETISWPVVVDDLGGTVQRAYGGLAASVYLIDAEGRVAFCGIWGQAPALKDALDAVVAGSGTGTGTQRGIDHVPHLGAAIVAGRGGPARGGRRALLDLEFAFPCAFFLMTVGSLGRPFLAPLAVRTARLPTLARATLLAGLTGGMVTGVRTVRRHRPSRHDRSASLLQV